ncbi:MAG: response regulator, partial [Planctomycetaceae bacterium]|nr:response regulator [Planctomycetaceae bacterium]
MDGVVLIERLRADPETADVPVVAITAEATEQAEQRARRAGVDDFLAKPIDFNTLLDRLHALHV